MSNFRVIVLMASHNGMPWIAQQIDSIFSQDQVDVQLYVSDDGSTDGTLEFLRELEVKDNRIIALSPVNVGGAGRNFYRLIKDVNIGNSDYVAFSDQDDIWKPDKLIRHIKLGQAHSVDGVSSNVTAFWADERQHLINKAQPQRSFDYLFESAGPGCTFLMTPWLVNKIRDQLLDENSPAQYVVLHDWLVYAICRAYGRRWLIDDLASVHYRQHGNNVVGANIGFRAKWLRLKKLRRGWYRQELVKIVSSCIKINPDTEMVEILNILKSKSYFMRLRLLGYISIARRSFRDRAFLALSILCGFF